MENLEKNIHHTNQEESLINCPFCGGQATEKETYIAKTGFMVRYTGCYAKNCQINPCASIQNSEVSDIGWGKSKSFMRKRLKEESNKAWNRRV